MRALGMACLPTIKVMEQMLTDPLQGVAMLSV